MYNKELVSEIVFLNNLNKRLSVIQRVQEKKVSGHNLKYFLKTYLSKAIDDLQKYIDNSKKETKK